MTTPQIRANAAVPAELASTLSLIRRLGRPAQQRDRADRWRHSGGIVQYTASNWGGARLQPY
jgi:hypothetical protein